MEFKLSLHAVEQAFVRKIPHQLIYDTIENPDKTTEETAGQFVYQKLVRFSDGKYTFCVFL